MRVSMTVYPPRVSCLTGRGTPHMKASCELVLAGVQAKWTEAVVPEPE